MDQRDDQFELSDLIVDWIVAAIAGVSMIGIEHWLGGPHRARWRRLV